MTALSKEFTITREVAQQRVSLWEEQQQAIIKALGSNSPLINLPILNVKAFTYELLDLKSLEDRINLWNDTQSAPIINGLRLYAAIKPADCVNNIESACLIAVPVTDFNPQTFKGGSDFTDLPPIPGGNFSSYYDFTFPCPPTCCAGGNCLNQS